MNKPITLLTIAAAAVFAAKAPRASKPGPVVQIDHFIFKPQVLTVRAGTIVTWVNKDDVPHTITSNDKKFKSQALDTDERFSYTFAEPGTNGYFCSVHPRMTGKIIVR